MSAPTIPELMEPNQLLDEVHDRTAQIVRKSITFTATGNGAVGAHALFTVTGDVRAKVIAVGKVNTTIQAGATVEVGIAGSTAAIIAQTAGDAPDAGEIWHDASPDVDIEADSVAGFFIITTGADIILTVATDTVDSGQIDFYCEWMPLSADGDVVAA